MRRQALNSRLGVRPTRRGETKAELLLRHTCGLGILWLWTEVIRDQSRQVRLDEGGLLDETQCMPSQRSLEELPRCPSIPEVFVAWHVREHSQNALVAALPQHILGAIDVVLQNLQAFHVGVVTVLP